MCIEEGGEVVFWVGVSLGLFGVVGFVWDEEVKGGRSV